MDQTEEELLSRTLEVALARGGDWAEVFVERRRSSGVRLEDGRIEDVVAGRDSGAGVRVIVGDRASYAYTNVLTQEGLAAAAEAARAGLDGDGSPVAALVKDIPEITHPVEIDPATAGLGTVIEGLVAADAIAREAGPEVRQVVASFTDVNQQIVIANSDGTFVTDDRTRVRFAAHVVAERDGTISTGFDAPGHTGGLELLTRFPPGEIAARAASKAIAMLDARPCPAGGFPVVLAPGTGGVLIHEACGHGLEADTLVKDASVYSNRQGERFGSEIVTIVDDATDIGAWGSFGVDDEGVPAQRTVLFDRGILVGHMSDRRSAAKIGHPPTGNGRRQSYAHLPIVRMTNTYLLSGPDDPAEIIRSVVKGVYAGTFAGGEVNPATGNFVFGMSEAYWIENGQIAYPIKGGTLIGNGPEVLGAIDAVASDFGRKEGVCGKDGQHAPVTNGMATVLLRQMTVGGTET